MNKQQEYEQFIYECIVECREAGYTTEKIKDKFENDKDISNERLQELIKNTEGVNVKQIRDLDQEFNEMFR
jgi:hypothetical protein